MDAGTLKFRVTRKDVNKEKFPSKLVLSFNILFGEERISGLKKENVDFKISKDKWLNGGVIGVMSFGRDNDNDIVLDTADVSRKHGSLTITIIKNELVFYYLDESTNGTIINGKLLRNKGTFLKPNDKIGIGKFTLNFSVNLIGV